jgi:tetratricopeptide (TPR) repeat protein
MAGEAIVLAREAHELSSESEADRLDACLLLAESLLRQVNRQEDDSMLDEMITFGREALAISPERHSSRARSCRNLAISL